MVEALKERYGRRDLQVEVYVPELLKLILNSAANKRQTKLSTLYDNISSRMRSLEILGSAAESNVCSIAGILLV